MIKLNEDLLGIELKKLPGWVFKEGSIRKTFTTEGFPQTMGLVTAIGAICQQHDHHPDYLTMKYASVEVSFSTHSVKSITNKDTDIAKEIEKLKF